MGGAEGLAPALPFLWAHWGLSPQSQHPSLGPGVPARPTPRQLEFGAGVPCMSLSGSPPSCTPAARSAGLHATAQLPACGSSQQHG